MTTDTCPGHAGVAEELRALAVTLLDRLRPALERAQDPGSDPPAAGPVCSVCPVCVLLTALRGGRPDLTARIAEHAAGIVAVLRTALDEGSEEGPDGGAEAPQAAGEPGPTGPEPARRPVQHIPVVRQGARR